MVATVSDSLGDRMKDNYENRNRHHLLPRVPVVVRVDGRAFHTYTKGLERPYSKMLKIRMIHSCQAVMRESSGCVAAYTQSDEASFLFIDYQTLTTQPWFGYDQSKIESITASIFTAEFNKSLIVQSQLAHFDARAFNIPREEVCNYFLWRMKDWERNSLQMYARAHFSHKELDGKDHTQVHEMLHLLGLNWTKDVSPDFRNGTWIFSGGDTNLVLPNYEAINTVLNGYIYCENTSS